VASQSGPVGPDLLLELQRGSGAPLHEQLELALREHVRSGRLAPGTKLPSSRSLAAQLGLSRGVVLEAYSQLAAEGYLVSSQGAQTRHAPMPAGERRPLRYGRIVLHRRSTWESTQLPRTRRLVNLRWSG